MKRIFLILSLLLSCSAYAGPDDLLLSQRNGTDTGNIQRIPPHPTTNWGVLSYDNSTLSLSWLTFGSGFSITSGVVDVTSSSPTWASITGTPTTLSGYGITDAYPLAGNPAGYITAINSGLVIAALGYTPYNASNPSSYVDQSGARTAISLTTIGTGAATYNNGTGALNIPTPIVVAFNYSLPTAKTVAVSTDYQAADPSKAAIITPSFACQNATTVLASSACTLQVRLGSSTLTCSTGTILYTVSQTVQLGVLLTQAQTVPPDIHLPIGAHFIVCPSAGTFTITATEQTAG